MMPSPWSQQVAGPQRKLKSGNMGSQELPKGAKMQGFPIVVYGFVYRGQEAWSNYRGPSLLLTAKSARRKEAMR